MRKKIVVGGAIVLVVGALLFIYCFFSPLRESVYDTTKTIPGGYYHYFAVEARSVYIHSEYTASDEVEFLVLDSHNFESFEAGEDFDEIYLFYGKSQTHTFYAPKQDTHYIILNNVGDSDVIFTVKISGPASWVRFIRLGGIGLSVIGFMSLIVGLILKPKMVEVPSRLSELNCTRTLLEICDSWCPRLLFIS